PKRWQIDACRAWSRRYPGLALTSSNVRRWCPTLALAIALYEAPAQTPSMYVQCPSGSMNVVGFASAYRKRFIERGSCADPWSESTWVNVPSPGAYDLAPAS